MEIELRQHLVDATARTSGAEVAEGTERSYPDMEFSGPAFGDGFRAVDIKCARRTRSGVGTEVEEVPRGGTPTSTSARCVPIRSAGPIANDSEDFGEDRAANLGIAICPT